MTTSTTSINPPHGRWLLLLILLVAAAIRLVGLNNGSPPGLEHDEVANWLIDRAILEGEHGVYFTDAYGHEAGFHYWQTLFVALLGDHALALRLPAALMGMLVVAVTYTLNRKLFGRDVGLLAMAVTAVLFTAVFYSRLGLRAIMLPFTAGLSAYYFWCYWEPRRKVSVESRKEEHNWRESPLYFLFLSALWAGVSSYTYLASRALPIFYGLFFLYLVLFHFAKVKGRWGEGALFWVVYGAVSYPLYRFLQNNPAAEFRVAEVNRPLNLLLEGDPQAVVENLWRIFLGFGVLGDPLWRQGVPDLPIFESIGAIGFYVGILFLLTRLHHIHYAFCGLWISCAVIPSLVTVDAPSTIRMILWLPFLATVSILGWWHLLLGLARFGRKLVNSESSKFSTVIPTYPHLSTGFPQLSPELWKKSWIKFLTLGILVFYGMRTTTAVFITWPQNEEVRFVWQATLTEIGRYLDQHPDIADATVIGWTPDTMDAPTLLLSTTASDAQIRHAGTVGRSRTLVLPPGGALFQPNELPIHAELVTFLTGFGAQTESADLFTLYHLPAVPHVTPQQPADQLFSEELRFLGYDQLSSCAVDAVCLVRSYWRVEKTSSTRPSLFPASFR